MTRLWRSWIAAACLICFMLSGGQKTAVIAQDEPVPLEEQALALLNSMSAVERVGQVFLVPFVGDAAYQDSDIADLIRTYHVGGVVLLAENDNITGYGNLAEAPLQVADLNNDLQRLALLGLTTAVRELPELPEGTAQPTPLPISTTPPPSNAVPLFVAINQERDGPIYSELFNGLEPLPSNMTLGATWRPENAAAVGRIGGRELDAIGVNMLLGPVLDVATNTAPGNGNLGVRSFGGDPYWVGLMGQAYTGGLHLGSNGRLAVIAKHFPGIGSSDRAVTQEIPTVRKSLDELRKVELAPFFAVTGSAPNEAQMVEGLLATHIRYQGFQGNIQASTAPVSFDRQALSTLLQLPELATWHQQGGLIVSDSLGARAVARYYDDTEQAFPYRRIAKDAFLAGNDLLLLTDFSLSNASPEQQLDNVKNTILWFQELYQTDPTFQQRLNEAVLRILKTKLSQYDQDFSPENVLVDRDNAGQDEDQGKTAVFDISQKALTLISPDPGTLLERLPSPPGSNDRIIIFTDLQEAKQCSTCLPQPYISVDALQNEILALYGPGATGQVQPEQIVSYTLDDLAEFLAAPEPIVLPTSTAFLTPTTPSEELDDPPESPEPNLTPEAPPTIPAAYLVQESFAEGVNWIVFALLDDADVTGVRTFLAQRPDLFRNANLIAFAFNTPYLLDSTEISKLTAYYGLYSKINPAINTAARALFQELPLNGRSPVSIEGVNYLLSQQTNPNPAQVIELFIVDDEGIAQSPASEAPLKTAVGDTLTLQTGVITDRNGNPVPDGTNVQFIRVDRIQGTVNIIDNVPTLNGMARLDYVLEARTGPGQFRITAVSNEATTSQEIDITIEGEAQVTIITPTPSPTFTPSPEPTATATATPTDIPTPLPTATVMATPPEPTEPALNISLTEFATLIAVLTGLALVGIAGYLLSLRQQIATTNQIAWVLWGIVGALLLYNYAALGLPGTAVFQNMGAWAGLLLTLLGGAAGLASYALGPLNRPR